jgi:hypothetical protein
MRIGIHIRNDLSEAMHIEFGIVRYIEFVTRLHAQTVQDPTQNVLTAYSNERFRLYVALIPKTTPHTTKRNHDI